MADPVVVKPLTLADLTTAKVGGTGVFDTLMTAMTGHLDVEYTGQRLKGQDYAQVYLGSLTAVLNSSVAFLLSRDEASGKAALINAQVLLAEKQIELAQLEIEREILNKELIAAQVLKVKAETISIGVNDLHTKQQTLVSVAQKAQIEAETAAIAHKDLMVVEQTKMVTAQIVSQAKQDLLLTAQTSKVNAEVLSQAKQDLLVVEQTKKIVVDTANGVLEGENLVAQNCLLKAQYDLAILQKLQTTAQTGLIQQKVATEKAQTTETGVDGNSVIGKQKLLYAAQTDGFARDAEQKLLKILVDTWNVRRTTDDGTLADTVNMLADTTIGRAVNKAITGVGA